MLERTLILVMLSALGMTSAYAGDVTIVDVLFERKMNKTWTVRTQLRHDDTGWEHYADGWRVVSETGEVLGTRVLHHPHVDEQPFTRSLENVNIPRNMRIVYLEAHDNVHGWTKDRVRVDLTLPEGPRYRVKK